MKKFLASLFLVVLCFILVGCGKESGLVGTWQYKDSDSFVYTFKADGTGTYTVGDTVMNFTYETDGNNISIKYEGFDSSFDTEYSIDDDVLNIKDSLGDDTLYVRK